MNTIFAKSKLEFYSKLRKDDLVRGRGSERAIRDLVDRIITYESHASQAVPFFRELREAGGASSNRDNGLIALDSLDVQEIAYTVGNYRDNRGLLRKMFVPENPMDVRALGYLQCYENFKRGGVLDPNYFDNDTFSYIVVAGHGGVEMESRVESLTKVFDKACEHINRKGVLLRLAGAKEDILNNYAEKCAENSARAWNGDLSWLMARWENDNLSVRQLDDISGYFRKQAEINGTMFKMLHFVSLIFRGDSNPEEATEKLHGDIMDHYKENGTINVSYVLSQK